MATPELTQALAARAAVRALWAEAMKEPDDEHAQARVSVTRIALGSYLNPYEDKYLPGGVEELLDRAQASAYYARPGSPGEQAWKDLYTVVAAALEPAPHTPSEGAST